MHRIQLLVPLLIIGLFSVDLIMLPPVSASLPTFIISGSLAYQPISFYGQVPKLDFVFIFVFSGRGCAAPRQIIAELVRADGLGAFGFKLSDGLAVGYYSARPLDAITGNLAPCTNFNIVSTRNFPGTSQ